MADGNSPLVQVTTDEELTLYRLLVQRFAQAGVVGMNCINELLEIINTVFARLRATISLALEKVQEAVVAICTGVREKVYNFFRRASEWAQNIFIAVVYRVNNMFNGAQTEAEALQAASLRIATAVHNEKMAKDSTEYVNNIFRDAKNKCALEKGMKNNENLNPRTLELLEISNSIAEKLGKPSLTDVQNVFEVLSTIVKDEFKKKMENYSKMLKAATLGTGKKIDIEVFNQTLDIKGSPTEHYWQEAMESLIELRLANQIKDKVENIANPKEILLSQLSKPHENSTEGVYQLMGVKGAGQITANQLVKVLKDNKFDLSELLVTNETTSMVMIQTKVLTLTLFQELQEDTSKGILLVMDTKV